ncbi:hypothetical protein Tco_1069796 [Tanacetum coccineum]|uniref:Uncharacterized protein n=1 Tax=Tanacetum coccineum TaxID=301880 RepID=A0ABQ5HKY4_9ASTR
MVDVLRFATLLSLIYVGVLSLPAQRRSSRLWQWDQHFVIDVSIVGDDDAIGVGGIDPYLGGAARHCIHVTIDKMIPHTFPTYEIVQQSDAADGVGHQLVEQSESTLVRGLGLWRDFKKRLITKGSFTTDSEPTSSDSSTRKRKNPSVITTASSQDIDIPRRFH